MKISIICPTENRLEFMPWLAFVFNGLRCPPGVEKELVVIDSSDDPAAIGNALIELVPANQLAFNAIHKPGCTIGVKRNLGLQCSSGTHVAWNDDDDGKPPCWIEWATKLLGDNEMLKVKTLLPFVNIAMGPVRVKWMGTLWYSAGLYTREAALRVEFNEKVRTGEDSQWHGRMMATVPGKKTVFLKQEGVGLTITHRKNIFNSGLKQIKYNHELSRPELWTPAEWEETVAEIKALQRRHK
jgi:hypothetical protein